MTTTYISLLRGINVSARKTIKMEILRQLYSEMGFNNAQTYIQSGNVVFQSSEENIEILESLISKKISERFKFDVPVLIIKLEDLNTIIANNPFLKEEADIPNLHVTFLYETPSAENLAKIEQVKSTDDNYKIIGKTVYICCCNGYGKTKLSNTFFENQLKVKATTRNWKTVLELQYMGEDMNQRH